MGQATAVPARLSAGGMTLSPTSVGGFRWEEVFPPLMPRSCPCEQKSLDLGASGG